METRFRRKVFVVDKHPRKQISRSRSQSSAPSDWMNAAESRLDEQAAAEGDVEAQRRLRRCESPPPPRPADSDDDDDDGPVTLGGEAPPTEAELDAEFEAVRLALQEQQQSIAELSRAGGGGGTRRQLDDAVSAARSRATATRHDTPFLTEAEVELPDEPQEPREKYPNYLHEVRLKQLAEPAETSRPPSPEAAQCAGVRRGGARKPGLAS